MLPNKGVGVSDDGATSPDITSFALKFLQSQFEGLQNLQIERAWSGIIGWSCDGMPWVGPLPDRPHHIVCAGFCGHGMSRAYLAGTAAADMCRGKKPEWHVDSFMPRYERKGQSWQSFEPSSGENV